MIHQHLPSLCKSHVTQSCVVQSQWSKIGWVWNQLKRTRKTKFFIVIFWEAPPDKLDKLKVLFSKLHSPCRIQRIYIPCLRVKDSTIIFLLNLGKKSADFQWEVACSYILIYNIGATCCEPICLCQNLPYQIGIDLHISLIIQSSWQNHN